MTVQPDSRDLIHAVARIHARILALVCAVIGGAGLFTMTAWLVVKGGPTVGPHLQLLGQYFYGYRVTWVGCFVGFFYGALVGGAVGWIIGTVYNSVVDLRR